MWVTDEFGIPVTRSRGSRIAEPQFPDSRRHIPFWPKRSRHCACMPHILSSTTSTATRCPSLASATCQLTELTQSLQQDRCSCLTGSIAGEMAGNCLEKIIRRHQCGHLRCQIFAQRERRLALFCQQLLAAIDNRQQVFQVVAGKEVTCAAPMERFLLGGNNNRRGDQSDRRAAWQCHRPGRLNGQRIPAVVKAQ
jgi:hypothetical protein